jgi:hypothetical protein
MTMPERPLRPSSTAPIATGTAAKSASKGQAAGRARATQQLGCVINQMPVADEVLELKPARPSMPPGEWRPDKLRAVLS